MTSEERSELFLTVYYRIITRANKFLKKAEIYSIAQINAECDPTIEEQVGHFKKLVEIFKALATEDVHEEISKKLNALQLAVIMERYVIAVAKNDEQALNKTINELNKHIKYS